MNKKGIHEVVNCIICAKCNKNLALRHKCYYVVDQNRYCKKCFKTLRMHNDIPQLGDNHDMWDHFIMYGGVMDDLLMNVPRIE